MSSYLSSLAAEAANCTNCSLHKTRCKVVFGSGPHKADIMIIGEAPGAEEDESGVPFVGRSGKLLTSLMEEAGLNRDEVYITNVVCCRPPSNRTPTGEEIGACYYFLDQKIATVKPRLIILVGGTAAKTLLRHDIPISKIRGSIGEILVGKANYLTLPIFHPSYLLRNPSRDKGTPTALTLRDLKLAAQLIKEKA